MNNEQVATLEQDIAATENENAQIGQAIKADLAEAFSLELKSDNKCEKVFEILLPFAESRKAKSAASGGNDMTSRAQVSVFVGAHCNTFGPNSDAPEKERQAFQSVKKKIIRYLCGSQGLKIPTLEQKWETRLASLVSVIGEQLNTADIGVIEAAMHDQLAKDDVRSALRSKLLEKLS